MESPDVRLMIQKARDGDADAIGWLLDRYRPYLRLIAQRQLDSGVLGRVDASDVVQQTCLEAFRDLAQFRGEQEAELVAWLRQILRNNVSQTVQKHVFAQRRSIDRERSLDMPGPTGEGLGRQLPDDQSSPSRKAMLGEDAVLLSRALESLPDDQREAVRLRHLEGWTLSQLAEHFKRSEVAVAGLLKRGLRTLRATLNGRG